MSEDKVYLEHYDIRGNKIVVITCKTCGNQVRKEYGNSIIFYNDTVNCCDKPNYFYRLYEEPIKNDEFYLENKEEEKSWCCWVLNESDIERVAENVFESGYTKGLITDDELKEIAKEFKCRLINSIDNWMNLLEEVVKDVTINKDIRMLSTFKRELKLL